MIDHISIRVSNIQNSVRFYEKALGAIGYKNLGTFDGAAGFGKGDAEDDSGHLWLLKEKPQNPLTQNVHIAFGVPTKEDVIKFHEAGLAAGGKDNGRPGFRPEYGPTYYGAFILDPDGNNIEATTYVSE